MLWVQDGEDGQGHPVIPVEIGAVLIPVGTKIPRVQRIAPVLAASPRRPDLGRLRVQPTQHRVDTSAPGFPLALDIESEGKPWGGRVNTVLRWLDTQSAQVWTAWGGGQDWSDPLHPWNFRTDWYEYGTYFNRNYGVSLPIFSILDPKHDTGLTLLQNFEDKIIKMNMASDEDGTLTFSRYNLRMGEGRKWRFRVELIPHAADVRAALGAVVARHPQFFDPPNPTAQVLGGHAAYSATEVDLEPQFRQNEVPL